MAAQIDENIQYTDPSTGELLNNGYIYIGADGLDAKLNAQTIYADRELTVPLVNPQRIGSDGRALNKIWVSGKYSMKVENYENVQKLNDLSLGEITPIGNTVLGSVTGINAVVADASPTLTALVNGQTYIFTAASTNTGPMTLTIGLTSTYSIKKYHDGDMQAGDIEANQVVSVIWNATDSVFELQSVCDSTGIDDNATSTQITISDTEVTFNGDIYADNSTERYATKAEAAGLTYTAADAGRVIHITSDDGGKFVVKYNATLGTYNDNGGSYCGTQFRPTGGDGTIGLVRDYDGAVNVKWFGLVDGDSTDNFSALTTILAASDDIYIPDGIFKVLISSSGTQFTPLVDTTIKGASRDKSILHIVSSTTAQKDIFKLSNSGFTLDSVGIDYDAPVGDGTHLFGMDSDNITIKNCDLDGNNTAINANVVQCFAWGNDNTVRTRILNNNIHNFQRCNLRGNTATGIASDIIYSKNTIYDLGEGGVQFNFPLGAASNVEISHNTFSNFTGGTEQIFCGGGGVEGFRIHSNHFYGAGKECVHFEENVTDAKVWGNNFSIAGEGVAISDNNISTTYYAPSRITIYGNNFREGEATPTNSGILIPNTGVGLNSAEWLVVTGNTFEGYLQGIKDDYGTVKITDNIFENCTTGIIQYQARPDTENNIFENCTNALQSIDSAGMYGKNSFRSITNILSSATNEKTSMLGFRIYIETDTALPASTTTNVDIGVDVGAEFYGKMKVSMYIDNLKWRHRISDCDYNGTTLTDTELMMHGSGDVSITGFVNNAGEISIALNNTAGAERTVKSLTFEFDGMWVSSA